MHYFPLLIRIELLITELAQYFIHFECKNCNFYRENMKWKKKKTVVRDLKEVLFIVNRYMKMYSINSGNGCIFQFTFLFSILCSFLFCYLFHRIWGKKTDTAPLYFFFFLRKFFNSIHIGIKEERSKKKTSKKEESVPELLLSVAHLFRMD